jgi:hypothetical protein
VSAVCHECGAILEGAATKHTLLGPRGCLDHLKNELAALTEKCGKCPICNPGQRNLCGDESGAARAKEGSKYCEEDIANSDRPLG